MPTHPFLHPQPGRNKQPFSPLYSSWNPHLQGHWGKCTWDMMFLLAADFPHTKECDGDEPYTVAEVKKRRQGWIQLLKALPNVLSCPVCAIHFEKYTKRYPVEEAVKDRDSLFEWLYRAKDEVNKRTKKKSPPIKKVKSRYIPKC